MDGSFVGRQKIIQLNDYMANLEHPGGIPAAAVIPGADDRVRRRGDTPLMPRAIR
jgi:hypothetical protein